MSARPPCDLGGLSVLVTRPAHQSDGLCELIQTARGRPVRFPALEILGPSDKHAARTALVAADRADMLIFVSANAVQYAFPLLPGQLPIDIDVAAVGGATARALAAAGLDPTLVPERMDSEGLLALPALESVKDKTVYILRGNGGRTLIREVLRERGAEVREVEVYRRQLPEHPKGVANLLQNWSRLVQVVTASSNQVLDNLFKILGDEGAQHLHSTPLIVVSQRMAEHALARGCESLYVANSANDEDVMAALCEANGDIA